MQERIVEQHREDFFGGDRRANRHHAAAERFRRAQNVRLHVFVLAGEHLAGTPHAGLDFVEDQQRAKLVAQLTHGRQIALRREDDAAFTLNGLGITAATSSPVLRHSLSTVRMALMSPNGTWRKPGSSGINGLRKVDFAVADSAPRIYRGTRRWWR